MNSFTKATLQDEVRSKGYFFLPENEDNQEEWLPGGIMFKKGKVVFEYMGILKRLLIIGKVSY